MCAKNSKSNLLWNVEEAIFQITGGVSKIKFIPAIFTTG